MNSKINIPPVLVLIVVIGILALSIGISSLAFAQDTYSEKLVYQNLQSNNTYIIVVGQYAEQSDYNIANEIKNWSGYNILIINDSDFVDDSISNIISIGGSCVNRVSANILNVDFPTCGSYFSLETDVKPNEFIFKTSSLTNNRIAILIAGYEAEDTRNAMKYLINESMEELQPGMFYIGNLTKSSNNSSNSTGNNSSNSTGNNSSNSTGNNTNQETFNISIEDFEYNPLNLTINMGDTVIWTNMDSVAHTVTSDTGNELNSLLIQTGEIYSHKFNDIGTYPYHCTTHPYMTGSITVQ